MTASLTAAEKADLRWDSQVRFPEISYFILAFLLRSRLREDSIQIVAVGLVSIKHRQPLHLYQDLYGNHAKGTANTLKQPFARKVASMSL